MTDIRKPRAGSLAFRPRKRARSLLPSINYWPEVSDKAILGFAGFKVGMTTIAYIDTTRSPTKGMEVYLGGTIIETPPIVIYGIRGYNGSYVYDEFTEEKEILKALNVKKDKINSSIPDNKIKRVMLLAYAQPHLTSIGTKHIYRMELGIGGSSLEEKLDFARSLLGKSIKAKDVFKEGMFVDVIAVTKGKGWQGPIKRFGVSKQRRKVTGKRRHVGTLGPFHPAYVMYTVPQAGQMGYHKRVELNKWIVKIGENPNDVNIPSGFKHYGVVKNDYIIVKGSVPGPVKRILRLRRAIRRPKDIQEVKLTFIAK